MNKEKLAKFKTNLTGGGRTKSPLFRPEIGKNTIRIIPNKYEKDLNFQVIKFHYNVGKTPHVCLSNYGEECPICNYVKELYRSGVKVQEEQAKKIGARDRFYTPIIVRTSEGNEGPYWLSLNYRNFHAVTDYADSFGDFTDILKGYDFSLKYEKTQPFPTTSISILPQCPMTNSQEEATKFIDELVSIEDYYEGYRLTKEEMIESVNEWINAGQEKEEASNEPEKEEQEFDEEVKNLLNPNKDDDLPF